MPGDRHDDRQDTPKISEAALTQSRDRHVRESVHQSVTAIRAQASRGAAGAASGGSIDARMDRIVSEQANHTQDAPGRTSNGDGRTNDTLRATLEAHRREMELAGVGAQAAAARNATRGNPNAAPTIDQPVRPEELPPRQAALRDPKNPESPGRPSITTMVQKHSYGPQNFSRTNVIDRPKSMPTIAPGGADAPPGPTPPSRAAGYADSIQRGRSGPSRSL